MTTNPLGWHISVHRLALFLLLVIPSLPSWAIQSTSTTTPHTAALHGLKPQTTAMGNHRKSLSSLASISSSLLLPSTTETALSLPSGALRSSSSSESSDFQALQASVTDQQRQQLLILLLAGATLQLAISVVLPAFPALALDLGLGASGVSLLVAVPSAVRLLLNLPMGQQADRRGRVPLMVFGELLCGLGVACSGLAASLFTIIPARIIVGIGGSMSNAGWHSYLADITQTPNLRPHRGVIMGIESSLAAAAWVAGPAIGGLVCEQYGPRVGFLLVGALISLCAMVLSLLPETLCKSKDTTSQEGVEETRKGPWALLANPTQQGVLAAHFALNMNYATNTVVIPLLATAIWGATAGQIGLMFSLLSIMSLVGAPFAGFFADRYTRKAVLIPSLFLMGLGSSLLGVAGNLPVFLVASVLWSAGEAFFVPANTALTADCAPPDQKGEALALSRQVSDFGFVIGPIAIGIIYDLGGPAAALGLLGLLNIGTAAFVAARVTETPVDTDSMGEDLQLSLQT